MGKIKNVILVFFIALCSIFLVQKWNMEANAYSDSWTVGMYIGACNYCLSLPNGDAHSGYVTIDSVTKRTCTTGAYVTFSCKCTGKCTSYRGTSTCGQVGYDSAAALGHSAGGYTETKDGGHTITNPTCTSAGSGYYIVTRKTNCSRCSAVISTSTYNSNYSIPALGHVSPSSYTYKTDGYHYKYCTRCGAQIEKQPNTYKIAYYSQDGSTCYGTSTHTYDVAKDLTLASALSIPGYTGYHVVWSRSIGGTPQYEDGQSVVRLTGTQDDTINLYLNWSENTYYVDFSGNNTAVNIYGDTVTTTYTGDTERIECTYNHNVTFPNCSFSKTGYEFKEWNTESDGTGQSFLPDTEYVKPNLCDQNKGTVTLYAIWEPIKYDIVFIGNGAWNGVGDYRQTMRYDQECALVDNRFTRLATDAGNVFELKQGYDFCGWGMAASDTEASYQDKEHVKSMTLNSEIYLYAIWRKEITLSMDLNGGTYQNLSTLMSDTHTLYNDEFYFDFALNSSNIHAYANFDVNTGVNESFSKQVVTDGISVTYRFTGWNMKTEDTVPFVNMWNGSVTNLDCFSPSHSSQIRLYDSLTLYAAWEPILNTQVKIGRTLGDISQTGSDITVNYVSGVLDNVATGGTSVFNPGEQGFYVIKIAGGNHSTVSVQFDHAMTNIYTAPSFVSQDGLNAVYEQNNNVYVSTSLLTYTGLDREYTIVTDDSIVTFRNTFFVPLYLGTENDPSGVYNGTPYKITYTITNPNSYFYNTYKGMPEQTISIINLYLRTGSGGNYDVNNTAQEIQNNLHLRLQ